MNEENKCSAKGIPSRLHQQNRLEDPKFDENEVLYRRFNNQELISGSLSASAFPMKNDSYNRQKYSESPDDVLFDTKNGNHFKDHGILSLPVGFIQETSLGPFNSGNQECHITFQVKHSPEQCMYPHTEIHCFKNGEHIAPLKPDQAKRAARETLRANSTIIRSPQM